jgi:glycosidase
MKKIIFLCLILTLKVLAQSLTPVPVKDGTKFSYKPAFNFPVKSVAVAGSMNDWDKRKNPMRFLPGDSLWEAVLPLAEGVEYSYKLVINDSLWITDPNAPNVTEDEWRNGLIIPQKYGLPYVAKAFPANGQRLNYIPQIKIKLSGVESPVDSASVRLLFDEKPIKYIFTGQEITAVPDSNITDGEHKISLKFADERGNKNENCFLAFFLDRFITSIETPKFYDSAVMYEVYIRMFADGNNDGTGDFRGLASKLDYLKNYLGVNALWLMPFNASSAEHGYNVTDYYSIQKDYGSFKDYLFFLKEAKKRGMKILMDFVINHTDSAHPFFLQAYNNPASKYSKWYQFTNNENTDWKHFGVERRMPKLDFENLEVQDYFIKTAEFWLDPDGDGVFTDGVDGFRCDAAKEVPHRFWNRFRSEVKKINPQALLLGEVWDNSNFLIPFYKNEFDMLFDYPFFYALDRYFAYNDIKSFTDKITELKRIYPAGFQSVRFLANHDNKRAFDKFGSVQKLKQALFIIMTLPGTPMIYYGDEIGLTGKLPPENVRQKMDWDYTEKLKTRKRSILKFYKNIIALRKIFPVLSERDDGKENSLEFLNEETGRLLLYLRYTGGKKMLAIVNNSVDTVCSIKIKLNEHLSGIKKISEAFTSAKRKNKISFNISNDYIFLNNLNMFNGSFKLFELK